MFEAVSTGWTIPGRGPRSQRSDRGL